MALSIVELDAIRTLLEELIARTIPTLASQYGILLDASAIVVDKTHLRLQLMHFVVRLYP